MYSWEGLDLLVVHGADASRAVDDKKEVQRDGVAGSVWGHRGAGLGSAPSGLQAGAQAPGGSLTHRSVLHPCLLLASGCSRSGTAFVYFGLGRAEEQQREEDEGRGLHPDGGHQLEGKAHRLTARWRT